MPQIQCHRLQINATDSQIKSMKYYEIFRKGIVDEHYSWVINCLAISKCPLGLIVNFGEKLINNKKNNFLICESVAFKEISF
ncbi:MAG: hypothetical protein V2A53_02120 [bacterium]